MRPLLLSVVAACTLVTAVRAEAFCRTTTTMPQTYNPTDGECWDGGVPLHWPMAKVPYGVASEGSPLQHITGAEATRVADLAFQAWKEAPCAGGTPSVQGFDDGPLASIPDASDCATSTSCDPVAHDVIVFDDDGGPFEAAGYTIALTSVSYGTEDGRIFEAKTEVNSQEFPLATSEPPAGSSALDLRVILTHEAGHFFGLAHAPATTSVMYYLYQSGRIGLMPDDVDAICAAYPPFQAAGGACSLTPARAHSPFSQALVALAALCGGCVARRRLTKARPRDRATSRC